MWEYLKRIYHQENPARCFQLEHEIVQYCQGTLSVQDYYFRVIALWTRFSDIA